MTNNERLAERLCEVVERGMIRREDGDSSYTGEMLIADMTARIDEVHPDSPDTQSAVDVEKLVKVQSGLESIVRLDKTRYEYSGIGKPSEIVVDRNGKLPSQGERWLTPREVARDLLAYIIPAIRQSQQVAVTFICAECGSIETSKETDSVDSGTVLKCSKCSGETTVLLCTTEKYRSIHQPPAIPQGHTVEGIDDIVEWATSDIECSIGTAIAENGSIEGGIIEAIIRHAIEEAVRPYAHWIGRVLYESYPAKDADDAYMLIIERELFNELHKFFDAEILPKLKEQDLKEDKS